MDTVEENLIGELLVRTDNEMMVRYLRGTAEISPMIAKYVNKSLKIETSFLQILDVNVTLRTRYEFCGSYRVNGWVSVLCVIFVF